MNLPLLLQFPDIYCDRQTKPNVTGISSAKDNEPKVIGMCLLRSRHSPDISFTVKRSRILTAFTSTAQNNLSIFIMIKWSGTLRTFTSSAKDIFPTFNFTVIRSWMISAWIYLFCSNFPTFIVTVKRSRMSREFLPLKTTAESYRHVLVALKTLSRH